MDPGTSNLSDDFDHKLLQNIFRGRAGRMKIKPKIDDGKDKKR